MLSLLNIKQIGDTSVRVVFDSPSGMAISNIDGAVQIFILTVVTA